MAEGDNNDKRGPEHLALERRVAQLEMELEEAREVSSSNRLLLDTIIDSAFDGIVVLDKDTRIVRFSPGMERIFKYAASELPDLRTWVRLCMPEAEQDATLASFWNDMATNSRPVRIFEICDADGQAHWCRFNLCTMGDGMVLMCQDITHLVEVENASKESASQLSFIFEHLPVGIALTAEGNRIKDANPALGDMLGYSVDELRQLSVFDLTHPDDSLEEQLREVRTQLSGGAQTVSLEKRYVRKDGSTLWADLTVAWLHQDESEEPTALSVIQDVTAKRRMEQELARVEKLESLGVLAGGLAHDFNNMLTSILGNTSLAVREAKPGSRLEERLRRVEAASHRAQDLTQQLLTFSRGGAPVKQTASINELLVESTRFALRGAGIAAEFDIDPALNRVDVDTGQLSQVMHNLAINASQATPDGGTLMVQGDNLLVGSGDDLPVGAGDWVRVRVSDTGVGISRENVTKVFDPYFSTKSEGNGLGLSSCYSIIKRHGGHISLESVEGRGTVVTVLLPASQADLSPREPTEDEITRQEGRVLVMDDDEGICQLAQDVLSDAGYEVVLTKDGQSAVDAFGESLGCKDPFDVVVLDLTVPGGMGGVAALAEMKRASARVRAIVVSGYSTDSVMADYESYGFVAALVKPYESGDLVRVVDLVLSPARQGD